MKPSFYELFDTIEATDERTLKHLSEAIHRHNLKDFDYIEFKHSVHAMRSMLDEGTAIKSAFATAKQMGLTKSKLLESIDHYMRVLDKERTQFDQALQQQVNDKVKRKREEKAKLGERIQLIEQKIQELKDKMAEAQKSIDNNDAEVAAAESKIQETKSKFQSAYSSLTQAMKADYEAIQSNI